MLSARTLVDRDGVAVRAVSCCHPQGGLGAASRTESYGVVVVRRGCFMRECDGAEQILDASMAYLNVPAQEERFAHHRPGGDECLAIDVSVDLFTEIFGSDRLSARAAIPLTASVAVSHRLLVADEQDTRVEAALALLRDIARCIRDRARPGPHRRVSAGGRQLVRTARQALADDPTLTLHQLATKLSVSSHHLSRTFAALTGRGVTRHRTELRISAALDRLFAGEENLARLAADLGFSDHAHLTRTLGQHTGCTPSQLRAIARPSS